MATIDLNNPFARQQFLDQTATPAIAPPVAPASQPTPQAAPQAAAGSDSLAQMLRIMSGDLSSLGTADKLMALSGLLRSATRSGRRAGLTPQQVLGQVQQQQLQRIQGRMQVEQLRAAEAQRQQQMQMVNEYAGALDDPQQRAALMALPPEEAVKKMAEVAFRPRQVQQIVTDENGETKLVFGDGTSGTLDFKLERGAKWIKGDPLGTGTEVLVKVDEKTGNPIMEDGNYVTMEAGTSWADQRRIANETERVRISRNRATSGGGRPEKQPVQITTVNGQQTYGVPLGGFEYRLITGEIVTGTPVRSSSGYQPATPLPPGGRERRFQQ